MYNTRYGTYRRMRLKDGELSVQLGPLTEVGEVKGITIVIPRCTIRGATLHGISNPGYTVIASIGSHNIIKRVFIQSLSRARKSQIVTGIDLVKICLPSNPLVSALVAFIPPFQRPSSLTFKYSFLLRTYRNHNSTIADDYSVSLFTSPVHQIGVPKNDNGILLYAARNGEMVRTFSFSNNGTFIAAPYRCIINLAQL